MRSRATWIALLAVVLAGGALRYVVMDRTFPVRPLGDEMYYLVVASNLAEGRGHVYGDIRALRPPAQAFWLSRFVPEGGLFERRPRGSRLQPARTRDLAVAQVALGTLLVAATALLAGALFDARAALAAGAFAAVYPTFVGYSHMFYSETLFALLVTLGLAAVALGRRRGGNAIAAAAGLAFGAAALAREIALPVAAMSALWWGLEAPAGARRRAWLRGAVLLAATLATIAPWTLRNYAVLGRAVPVATVGWIGIGEGNALEGDRWLKPTSTSRNDFRRRVNAAPGELGRADLARKLALEMIADAQPLWIFRKIARNVPLMLLPDAFHLYKLRSGSYGDVPEATVAALRVATALAYAAVFAAGLTGMFGAPSGRRLLPLLVLGAVLAFHVVANAHTRYRMPWMPVFVAYAGFALTRPRETLAALGTREWIGLACALAILLGVGASYFLLGVDA